MGSGVGPAREAERLGGVAHRLAHPGYAALVDEIRYQLHFRKAFEISDFWCKSCLDESLEAGVDQLWDRAPQHRLLVEQIGLAFLGEAGLEDGDPARRERGGGRERDAERCA